jgi:G-patch domain
MRDSIDSGPQLEGLQVRAKRIKLEVESTECEVVNTVKEEAQVEETEEQRAIRALLAGAGGDGSENGAIVDVVPACTDRRPTEDDAFRQDIDVLPDEATLADYERVPVSQFGAALLRGMGWKEGTAASKTRKGPVEPWLPQARPALLGIGAKEKELFDDGSGGKRGKPKPERRYVPVVKREREESAGDQSGSSSRRRSPEPPSRAQSSASSRRASRSPSPVRRSHQERDYNHEREYFNRDRGGGYERRGDQERDRQRERSPRSNKRSYDRRR